MQELCAQIDQPPVKVEFTAPAGKIAVYDDATDVLNLSPEWFALTDGPGANEPDSMIFHELAHRRDRRLLTAARRGSLALFAASVLVLICGLLAVMLETVGGWSAAVVMIGAWAQLVAVGLAMLWVRWTMEFRADDFAADRMGSATALASALALGATEQKGGPNHPPPAMRVRRQIQRLGR